VSNISPESPEERLKREALAKSEGKPRPKGMRKGSRGREIVKRVAIGVYSEGFIHAGNLAYLSLISLFPFFIVAAAIARLFGQTQGGRDIVIELLSRMPPSVADVLSNPIHDVLEARSGNLLWLGAIVGLWTTGGFIESVRDIIRRAYGVTYSRPFWEYRLGSMGLIIGSVVILLVAFAVSVFLSSVQQFAVTWIPGADEVVSFFTLIRIVPPLMLYASLYLIFVTLTPKRYRTMKCRKWPGVAFVTIWWIATTALLPLTLSSLGGYDLTYGSLAGVMITLIFFFVIGFGLVIGAHLNAALAEPPEPTAQDIREAKAEEGTR
jgi:membrane protein